jgi:glucans biosynthesis protein
MHPDASRMNQSPRCGARTRCGSPCRSPAVKGKRRCRMLGGAAGSGARAGNRNALRHGRYSHEMLEFRRMVRELARQRARLVQQRWTLFRPLPAPDFPLVVALWLSDRACTSYERHLAGFSGRKLTDGQSPDRRSKLEVNHWRRSPAAALWPVSKSCHQPPFRAA